MRYALVDIRGVELILDRHSGLLVSEELPEVINWLPRKHGDLSGMPSNLQVSLVTLVRNRLQREYDCRHGVTSKTPLNKRRRRWRRQ